jgi:hypothetical protein
LVEHLGITAHAILIKVPTRVGRQLLEQPLDLNFHLPSLLHWRGLCATSRPRKSSNFRPLVSGMRSRPGLRGDQLGQRRRLIFLQEMFAG